MRNFHFFSKYVFIYFAIPYFVIARGDGLVVKALECGWKGFGFKLYLMHSTKNPKFGDSKAYDVNWHDLPIMSTQKEIN
jgi:hypothetical protein